MLGPDKIKEAPLAIQKLMLHLQDYGIRDIARRIAKNGKITSSAEYQLTTMMEQDIFNRNFKEDVRKILGMTEKQIDQIFRRAAEANYIYDKRAFSERGIPFIPFEDNNFMQSITRNIINVTKGTLQNITNSLGFAKRINGQLLFQPIARFYQSELDLATTSVAAGVKTFDGALKDAVHNMADSGIRTVDYATGHQDRIDVAARRAMMGGMRSLTNSQSDYNSNVMGTTVYEISWHGGHRPSHAWGGRRFDTKGIYYPTEEQLYAKYTAPDGTIGTLEDYNCYHEKYAIFHDAPPKYTDEQLKKMYEEQQRKIEYEGKEYTEYEARQQQRFMERVMRRQRGVVAGYEGAVEGAQENQILVDGLRNEKIKMRILRKQYRDFSSAMGIDPEFERL